MTAIKQGPEAVAEAHCATLIANLATEMTWVWSAWGDTATVPQPAFTSANILPYAIQVQFEYPAITVVPQMVDTMTDNSPLWYLNKYQLHAYVYIVGDNEGTVQKQMMRVLQAIWRVYVNNPNLDSSLSGYSGTTVGRRMLSDVYNKQASALLLQVGGLELVTSVGDSY